MTIRILAFGASLRRESYNKRLVAIAAQGAREEGAEVTILDIAQYPLPLYNADDEAEQGRPENVEKLREMFKSHDGFLISSPEYNGGFPGVLKNLMEWLSRRVEGEKPFAPFFYKPVVAMSASPGSLGGNRMMAMLRAHLLHMHMLVLPETLGLARADKALDEIEAGKDDATAERVKNLGRAVAKMAARLARE